MKKVAVLILLISLPAIIFAQVGFGLSAFYNTPIEAGTLPETNKIHAENFTFGPDLRLKLSILQGEALALVSFDPFVADIFLNAGLVIDLAIFSISAGIGPKFTYASEDSLTRGGYDIKLNADILLGSISLGVSYIFNTTLGKDWDVRGRSGLFGVSFLLW